MSDGFVLESQDYPNVVVDVDNDGDGKHVTPKAAIKIFEAAVWAAKQLGVTGVVRINAVNFPAVQSDSGEVGFACYSRRDRQIYLAAGSPTQELLREVEMTSDEWFSHQVVENLFHEIAHMRQDEQGLFGQHTVDEMEQDAEQWAARLMMLWSDCNCTEVCS